MSKTQTRDMLGRQGLMAVDQALHLLLDHLDCKAAIELIALEVALDRITACEILAPENLPQYPRSTMDGYAVMAADTFGASESMPCYLQIQGEVLMGENPSDSLSGGHCFKIATGGLLPPQADSVVMFEHTVPVDATMIEVVKSVGQGANVIQAGDDIRKNTVALPAGHQLRPQDLGLLAGLGITEIEVRKRIKFGILSTGDEIIDYGSRPQPGKIRNINSIAIAAQARRLGADVTDYGIVSDRQESFFPAIQRAVSENDVVVFSGGSSVGTRDLGEKAIDSLGTPGVLVHGVALKPGKPILIGLHGDTPIFGLPGHPVSAMTCFELFVSAAMEKLAGKQSEKTWNIPAIDAVLAKNIPSAPGRKDIVRVQLRREENQLKAYPVLGKSGSISTLSRSHGYIVIEEPLQGLNTNSDVKVHLYQ
ncbi:molybdopterin molybdotransferase MoeA [Desulfopila inferna]|uniref:molybdopterin molybdotransferase MoeA n=1 Tax=Desulfopila inferna TaxID=468528 RepID=UPI001963A23C|nr:gephyrin-like molybdotransferase Glp [Desulfopila inferna]MBM9602628.1 molybdopterin molybdotransferase MoeA [Desulfopila inferna]